VPATASLNTYAIWDNGSNTYTTLEAAPTYGVLEGARLSITRTLPSSGTLGRARAVRLSLGGSLTPSGVLPTSRTLRRVLSGLLGSSGVILLGKIFTRSLVGNLGSNALTTLNRLLPRSVSGVLGSSGLVSFRQLQRVFVQFDGTTWLLGELKLHVLHGPWPPLDPTTAPKPPVLAGVDGAVGVPLLLTVVATPPPALGAGAVSSLAPSLVPSPRRQGPPPLVGEP